MHPSNGSHVFISYVHEDAQRVEQLRNTLEVFGIKVWLDRDSIQPGQRWADAIRAAIRNGAYFIACFSKASESRSKSYMNEELVTAIDELRLRPTDKTWFISVLLDDVTPPDRSIGGGETLRSLQWVNLYENAAENIPKLLAAIDADIGRQALLVHRLHNDSARVRVRAVDDLAKLGAAAKFAVSDLAHLLTDENETVRAAASEALSKVGCEDAQVIESLTDVLHNDPYAGRHAAIALSTFGLPGAVPLLDAAGSDDNWTAGLAIEGLRRFSDPTAAKCFLDILPMVRGGKRVGIALALANLRSTSVIPELERILEVIPGLKRVFDDEEDPIRRSALEEAYEKLVAPRDSESGWRQR